MLKIIADHLQNDQYPFPEFDDLIIKVLQTNLEPSQHCYVLKKDLPMKQLEQKYLQLLQNENLHNLAKYSLLFMLIYKIENEATAAKLALKQVKQSYFYLFLSLQQPKTELINFAIFITGYLVHRCMYEMFPFLQISIDTRFVQDIYHILIHNANGIIVSDTYIKQQIEQYFNGKLFDYQGDDMEKLKKKSRKQFMIDKTFLGHQLNLPVISMKKSGENFANEISASKLIKRSQINQNPEKTFQKRKIDLNNLNIDDKELVQKTRMQHSQSAQFISHLNLMQISPSIADTLLLSQNTLQQKVVKVVSHNIGYQNPNEGKVLQMLNEIQDEKIMLKLKTKIKPKVIFQLPKIIDQFNLKIPPAQYFRKHPNLDHQFKPMLELNYVLDNHRETLSNAYFMQKLKNKDDKYDSNEQINVVEQTPIKQVKDILIDDIIDFNVKLTDLEMSSIIHDQDEEEQGDLKFKHMNSEISPYKNSITSNKNEITSNKNEITMAISQITTQLPSSISDILQSSQDITMRKKKKRDNIYSYIDKRSRYTKDQVRLSRFKSVEYLGDHTLFGL